MKILYVLPVLLGLCACHEKPIYTADRLHCGDADSTGITKIEIYKNYAIVYSDLFKQYAMDYSESTGFHMDLVRQFDYVNIYEKNGPTLVIHANPISANLDVTLLNYKCFFEVDDGDVLKEKEYSLQSKTKKIDKKIIEKLFTLSDIEKINRCINAIAELTHLQEVNDENIKYAVVVNDYGILTQEQALRITKNWDYNDIKLYNHEDQKLQEHEKDACVVLERLNKFIEENKK